MTDLPVSCSRAGDVFVLTMSRPERLNAMSVELLNAALASVNEAEASSRALVLTGAGRAFCSGADLQGGLLDMDAGAALETAVNPLLERIAGLSIPVVTAINGPAAGAGAGLALAGDFAVMARSAYFLLAFVNVGLVPDAGLSFLLPRLIGRQRAAALMMLGERLPSEKALEWGLIYQVADDEALLDEAIALAQRLAAGPTRAYAIMRDNLRRSLDSTFTESLRVEREGQRVAGRTADFAEGVKAFGEKRKPAFQGK